MPPSRQPNRRRRPKRIAYRVIALVIQIEYEPDGAVFHLPSRTPVDPMVCAEFDTEDAATRFLDGMSTYIVKVCSNLHRDDWHRAFTEPEED